MSSWRREALNHLPELRGLIEPCESPMMLWIELHGEFEDAVRNNIALSSRILAYASWCISEAAGPLPNDTSTAVACAFYEHLPQRREHWPYFREWFTPGEFARLVPVFAYHLSNDDLEALKVAYQQGQSGASTKKLKLLRVRPPRVRISG